LFSFLFCTMRKGLVISALLATVFIIVSFTSSEEAEAINLRKIYSAPPSQWPTPNIDPGVAWEELGVLPPSPVEAKKDSRKHLVELGKVLFFDTRLSGSGKISCGSCHKPELSWTDGKRVSEGHEGALNKRNSPSLHNVWFFKKLFHDGRAHDLEDQAFAPINSETEMHGDIRNLGRQLKKIPGYIALFDSAFGDPGIDPDRIASALAMFQRTIVSRKSRFDLFLEGDKNALSNSELRGLHLFRTKARCMNCHYGPLFSDNSFHRNGFNHMDSGGRYNVTHIEADRGRYRTPSLRDVANSAPYMQNGGWESLDRVVSWYVSGKAGGYWEADSLIRPIHLRWKDQADLIAFLKSISAPPLEFQKPELP
jgi:cytochrome c peroxidase